MCKREDKVVVVGQQRPVPQDVYTRLCDERYRIAAAERSGENTIWIGGENHAVAFREAAGQTAGKLTNRLRRAAVVVGFLQRTIGRKQKKTAVRRPERLRD